MKRVVFITGANGSLGRALAEGLAAEHTVIASDVDDNKDVADTEKYISCDVTSWVSVEAAMQQVIAEFGRVDVLINCAGLYTSGPIEDIDPQQAERLLKVNALGPLLLAKAVVPHMKQAGQGLIININSIGGVSAKPDRSVYYSSKWAMTGITKNLQVELSPHNIRVSDIYLAALESSMQTDNGIEHKREKSVSHQDVLQAVEYIISRPNDLLVGSVALKNTHY